MKVIICLIIFITGLIGGGVINGALTEPVVHAVEVPVEVVKEVVVIKTVKQVVPVYQQVVKEVVIYRNIYPREWESVEHFKEWYQAQEFRENLTDPMRKLIEYEAEATSIHSYSVFHVPGLLQVPEYSAALTEAWGEELTAEQIRVRVEARRLRRDAVLARLG